MILEKLKTVDPAIHGMASTDGMVWLSPGLQGRIFCSIGDRLAHKLDFELASNPTDGFNNIGGNSLWPGPEGGAFAYNYPHGEWTVQDGINKVCPTLSVESPAAATMVKNISLLNAKGTQVELEYRRRVQTLDISSQTAAYAVKGVAYTEMDTFTPLREYSVEDAIVCAWSLEQFNGAEGSPRSAPMRKRMLPSARSSTTISTAIRWSASLPGTACSASRWADRNGFRSASRKTAVRN